MTTAHTAAAGPAARLLMSLLAVALLAVAATPAFPQTPAGWEGFRAGFAEYVQADGVVGASALVLRDGVVLDRVDIGFADRATRRVVDDRTLFHWGSITKTLTAIAILQLRDRGRLGLDDPVTRYLPELRRIHDGYGMMDSITVRMLLSHSAGFQNSTWPYGEGRAWEPFEPTGWGQLVAMMPYQQLHFRPGTRYGYSNPAFIYLARIIEQLSGDPWEDYVRKNIFAPLRLDESYFRTTPYYLAPHRSHNYTAERDSGGSVRLVDHGPDFDPGITTPNGGWNASLQELARYAAFLTAAHPAGAEPRAAYELVLKRSSLEEMWQPVVPMSAGYQAAAEQWMGLSFFVRRRGTTTVLGHTGSQAGFRAFLYFNPATRTAVIAAFNTTNYAQPATALYERLHENALQLLF